MFKKLSISRQAVRTHRRLLSVSVLMILAAADCIRRLGGDLAGALHAYLEDLPVWRVGSRSPERASQLTERIQSPTPAASSQP